VGLAPTTTDSGSWESIQSEKMLFKFLCLETKLYCGLIFANLTVLQYLGPFIKNSKKILCNFIPSTIFLPVGILYWK
jgi:hypothetical protein